MRWTLQTHMNRDSERDREMAIVLPLQHLFGRGKNFRPLPFRRGGLPLFGLPLIGLQMVVDEWMWALEGAATLFFMVWTLTFVVKWFLPDTEVSLMTAVITMIAIITIMPDPD